MGWTGRECHGIYSVDGQELQPVAGITARSFAIGAASWSGSTATLQLLVVDETGTLLEARWVGEGWSCECVPQLFMLTM